MCPKIVTDDEIRWRETSIIDRACTLIVEKGFSSLTMEALSREIPYSKGTLYGHFSGQQDLILGICNDGMMKLTDLLDRVSSFGDFPRDRKLAQIFCHLLYQGLYPARFKCMQACMSPAVAERASRERCLQARGLDAILHSHMLEPIRAAMTSGDLPIADVMEAKKLGVSIWYAVHGTVTISRRLLYLKEIDLDVGEELFRTVNYLMDGAGWRPLSGERNYRTRWQILSSEVFSAEERRKGLS